VPSPELPATLEADERAGPVEETPAAVEGSLPRGVEGASCDRGLLSAAAVPVAGEDD
jgi:hypothetical protein